MIRKGIIIGLVTLAVATVVAWGATYARWANNGHPRPLSGTFGAVERWKQRCGWAYHSQGKDGRSWFYRMEDGALTAAYFYSLDHDAEIHEVSWRACGLTILRSSDKSLPGLIPLRSGQRICHLLHLPLWIPVILFVSYPTIAFARGFAHRWRHLARLRRGYCVRCGYSLTGNVTGVCPECGEPTAERS